MNWYYLFSREGEDWIPTAILKGDRYPEPSWFGFDVFTDGEIVAIGAPYTNESGQRGGAVYIYI